MKWITSGAINCREVQGSRVESHNSLTGVPVFRVRLEIPKTQIKSAYAELLGIPETWPHDTNFLNVRAISAEQAPDVGAYTTDGDAQIITPSNDYLVDMTYTPRPGVYVEDFNNEDVYWDDVVEPVIESRPMDHSVLMWGGTDASGIPSKHLPLHPDAAPQHYEIVEQLTHTIEGWTLETDSLGDAINTCNDEEYISVPLHNRVFPVGTLLLRNVIIIKGMTFRSYRLSSPTEPYAGLPTLTLKLIYQYKKIGWQKFWHIEPGPPNVVGYHYIRHRDPPYDIINPTPNVSHHKWLSL